MHSTGISLKSAEMPGNTYPQRPSWSYSGEQITLISLSPKGEGVLSWSLEEDKWDTLIEPRVKTFSQHFFAMILSFL